MYPEFIDRLRELVDANRATVLWPWPEDFFPETPESAGRVLRAIASRGNRATFVRAGRLLRELNGPRLLLVDAA